MTPQAQEIVDRFKAYVWDNDLPEVEQHNSILTELKNEL